MSEAEIAVLNSPPTSNRELIRLRKAVSQAAINAREAAERAADAADAARLAADQANVAGISAEIARVANTETVAKMASVEIKMKEHIESEVIRVESALNKHVDHDTVIVEVINMRLDRNDDWQGENNPTLIELRAAGRWLKIGLTIILTSGIVETIIRHYW